MTWAKGFQVEQSFPPALMHLKAFPHAPEGTAITYNACL
jgi:hypothetical protein